MAAEIDNDGIGQDSTWNGLDWSPPVNTPYQAQGGVECATPTSCVIVNLGLQMMTWNGSTWSTSSNSEAMLTTSVSLPPAPWQVFA